MNINCCVIYRCLRRNSNGRRFEKEFERSGRVRVITTVCLREERSRPVDDFYGSRYVGRIFDKLVTNDSCEFEDSGNWLSRKYSG